MSKILTRKELGAHLLWADPCLGTEDEQIVLAHDAALRAALAAAEEEVKRTTAMSIAAVKRSRVARAVAEALAAEKQRACAAELAKTILAHERRAPETFSPKVLALANAALAPEGEGK